MDPIVSTPAARLPYSAPRLVVFGRLQELTLTESDNNNKNDMFGNFKTL